MMQKLKKKSLEKYLTKSLDKTIIFVSHNKENHKFCDLIYEVKNKSLINFNN